VHHDLVLAGHGVRLEPLTEHHAPALHALVDDALWAGMTFPRPADVAAWEAWARAQLAAEAKMVFAVVTDGGPDDGRVRGSTSYYELAPGQRRTDVGSTFYGRDWWGAATNPACKLLLLAHAFETWGFQRVGLRADARNTRSCAAIERLGAVREGVLRKHRLAADGSPGDTVYFSVTDDEWPTVRANLVARLAAPGV
jgi:RimJ/RimL family protein N-acetyltransferase